MLSELQALAEALAQRLDRAVAIDDPHLHLLVHTAHSGVIDPVRTRSILERTVDAEVLAYAHRFGVDRTTERWVRVDALPERDLMARVCAPIRAQGVLLGYLWIIEADPPLTADELADVADVARSAALVMHRERMPCARPTGCRARSACRCSSSTSPARHSASTRRRSSRTPLTGSPDGKGHRPRCPSLEATMECCCWTAADPLRRHSWKRSGVT